MTVSSYGDVDSGDTTKNQCCTYSADDLSRISSVMRAGGPVM